MSKTQSFPTLWSIPVIAASLLCIAVASVLPASARQTAGQKRYEAWAACRREATSAVPLSGMISTEASMNHYLALGSCLRQRGYDINVTQGGTVGPPGPGGSVAGVARRTTRRAVAARYYGYDYRSSYPYNYGYTNYDYGYANYGSSYGSTNYGSSYPYNYGYSDNRFPLSNLELWCFPPTCDRSRFDEKNAPQSAVPWAGQSLVQRSATPLPGK